MQTTNGKWRAADGEQHPQPPVRWSLVISALVGMVLVLAFLPGRESIPPHIHPDYCYQLIAADRLYDGAGLTSLQPVAPKQPWVWEYDFGFLTQWPIGYPLLVCAVRYAFGLSTVQACQWISVVACATALVGWFTFIKRYTPAGVTGTLLAAVAAGCSVSVASLINPSSDALLVALEPFALLFAAQGVEHLARHSDPRSKRMAFIWIALAGFLAGTLFWFRYASVFLPLAIGVYLLVERRYRRRLRGWHIAVYTISAVTPIVAILLLNHVLAAAGTPQQQFNLGHRVGFDLSLSLLTTTWWKFSDFGFYDYHRISHWLFALWPAAVVAPALGIRSARRAMLSFLATPAVCLGVLVVAALLAMLVSATTLFGDKHDYASWDRYYLPARPLYLLLFVAPVLLIPWRFVRAVLCVTLLIACSWTLQQDWARPYRRWLAAKREVTPYGERAVCFTPGAADLYEWLSRQQADNLIVVSNFREYITLETKMPVLPIPDSRATLNAWVERVCAVRGITQPRVLFVLDPDNHWRSYWLAKPADVIQTFGLTHHPGTPPSISAMVLEYGAEPDTRLAGTDHDPEHAEDLLYEFQLKNADSSPTSRGLEARAALRHSTE